MQILYPAQLIVHRGCLHWLRDRSRYVHIMAAWIWNGDKTSATIVWLPWRHEAGVNHKIYNITAPTAQYLPQHTAIIHGNQGPLLNKKTTFPGYVDFHYKDKTVMRISYLYNRNPYIGATSLYWEGPWPLFETKTLFYQYRHFHSDMVLSFMGIILLINNTEYRNFHLNDKMVIRPSYLYNGNY